MITITQFSSTQLKLAKAATAALPQPEKPVPSHAAPLPAEDAGAPIESAEAPAEEGAAPIEAGPDGSATAAEGVEADAAGVEPAESPTPDAPSGETAKPPAAAPAPAYDERAVKLVMEKLSLDEKKAKHLLDALAVAGNRLDRVRTVRVVQLEGAPRNAVKRGEFGYIVDLPEQAFGKGKRRGGFGRGPKRGPRRDDGLGGKPGASGKTKEDPNDLSGMFSMESVKEDRRREAMANRGRGGRPGGPGGRGRGGRPGGRHGGRPGGRPGGPGGGRGPGGAGGQRTSGPGAGGPSGGGGPSGAAGA